MSPIALGGLGVVLLISAAQSRAPRTFARFAVLPVGKRLTLPLPPAVAARVLRPRGGTGTYRTMPDRDFTLAELPGENQVEGAGRTLTFVAEANRVLATGVGLRGGLVRVDLSGTVDGLSLAGHRIPEEGFWLALLFVLLPSAQASTILFRLAFIAGMFAWDQRKARVEVRAVAEELRKRIAVANGDSAAVAAPGPTLLADEWACACGKVNKARHETCGRCWAQRRSA